jgi:hypothetical protein
MEPKARSSKNGTRKPHPLIPQEFEQALADCKNSGLSVGRSAVKHGVSVARLSGALQVEKALADYREARITLDQIAAKCAVTGETIRNWAERAGLPLRRARRHWPS